MKQKGWAKHCFSTFIPNRSLDPVHVLCIAESFTCLILEGVAHAMSRNNTGKMPTSNRKMDRKRWKRREIVDKWHNGRLGFIRKCYLMNGIWHEDAKCT